ncbi:hypothetical protein [Clostridium lacusfryxellense]|uniref:hypothetical protein n=1 Tax=Clostridium lacusfryxellense TaxID=205328 RepID=UPI001C0BD378|nr:hypothetical protein [Clostridium lacusfryxellense]MBU3112262.1 hypothetical protein [Clostridium lacusfryxellense]
MSEKRKIYRVTISQEGLDNYNSADISANAMAENLCIDSVMTDFEWDEDIKKGIILTGRIIDDMSVEDAFEELKNAEYIENVEES